jgi:murein DD-endopeptidase MepM/ murein hydrolase activator NlpD
MYRDRDRRPGRAILRLFLFLAFLGLAFVLLASLWVGGPPTLEAKPRLPGIGARTPIDIRLSDASRISRLVVEVVQGQEVHPVLEKEFPTHPAWQLWKGAVPAQLTAEVGRETVRGLRSGKATVRVTAERVGAWLRRPEPLKVEKEMPVRLAPPSVSVMSSFHYVAQGGSEVVVFQVSDGAESSGVQSGSWWFPSFPMGSDPKQRFVLFGIPYDLTDPAQIRLVARDDVGNQTQISFVDKFTPRPIKTDTIQLDDAYLAKVVPEILQQSPEVSDQGDPLKSYLVINRELRKKNAQVLKELAARSAARFLWSEPFLPMQNAAIMAHFADRRTYVYKDQPVDQQDHLGFDMASTEHAPIQAANRGVVVLARFFGIYGNAVVIDHGYGLMTLYGHLSSIGVKEGAEVTRGQEIGRSGRTGLAGGDHLHFTTLLHGLPVNPIEWWDLKWLTDRVQRKLGAPLAAAAPAAATTAPAAPPA